MYVLEEDKTCIYLDEFQVFTLTGKGRLVGKVGVHFNCFQQDHTWQKKNVLFVEKLKLYQQEEHTKIIAITHVNNTDGKYGKTQLINYSRGDVIA